MPSTIGEPPESPDGGSGCAVGLEEAETLGGAVSVGVGAGAVVSAAAFVPDVMGEAVATGLAVAAGTGFWVGVGVGLGAAVGAVVGAAVGAIVGAESAPAVGVGTGTAVGAVPGVTQVANAKSHPLIRTVQVEASCIDVPPGYGSAPAPPAQLPFPVIKKTIANLPPTRKL
jgi:hypothetical protein